MNTGKLIVIAAPSGSGKTTVVNSLISDKTLNLGFSISATSRPRRENEIDGKDYYSLSDDEFKNKIDIEYMNNYKSIHKIRNDVAFRLNCDYITFLDDDDQWKPDYISRSLELIKEKKLDALYTSMDVVDENSIKISEINLKKNYKLSELLVYNPGFLTSNLIVNKEVFKNLDGFSYEYGSADKHFFIRIIDIII